MNSISSFYTKAKRHVNNAGFSWEIEWQGSQSFTDVSESEFLREYAWVVMCSGFRESVVRQKFDYISMCFCDWESAKVITENRNCCIESALMAFKNKRKIHAIADTAEFICSEGFGIFSERVFEQPIDAFSNLPQIGKVTAAHLAKNLGYPVAKADRHLVNLTNLLNMSSVENLCANISKLTGDPVQVVDVVLWRYMVLLNSSKGGLYSY